MRRHKIITKPIQLQELSFEDLFDEEFGKIRHDWQKTSVRPHLRGWKNHTHKLHHA
jgi:hypothetical protein